MSELIAPHLQWLRLGRRSATTIDRRGRLLRHAARNLPNGLDAYTEELAYYLDNDSWSDWTAYTYDAYLRCFYTWGVEYGHFDWDPMAGIPRPREGERLPNPCTDDELARLLAEAPEHPWRNAILLGAYGGLRISEAANCRRQDITEERLRIRDGKGKKDAYVETHPLIWAAVKDLPPGSVVRDPDGSPVTGYQLMNRGWYLYRKLGMPEMRFHRLRHWHATSLLAGGADLETVRQCMRHASIVSTVGYTRVLSKARRTAVHGLPLVGHGPVAARPVSQATSAA